MKKVLFSDKTCGLAYPGVGWIIWRDQNALAEDLVFKVNYLGGEMDTFALNFSRPGSQIVAQYDEKRASFCTYCYYMPSNIARFRSMMENRVNEAVKELPVVNHLSR
jgi:Pyridoxal-dependent decarboxylase conserved domain